ncbi:hypothetical protein VTK73DRAFT_7047 [Phialemonium thermophilum]|uniref:BRCT domain-containing protein n=1 Tax=Phialemonium thermophilum TaxID=223376 RepID=A0ABR3WGR4_9PEZI
MAEAHSREGGIFDSCQIAFVLSKSLSAQTIAQLSDIVKKNGAQVLDPDRNGKIPIHEATHIVSNTIDFNQYSDAQNFMIPVVRSDWIKASLVRNRQAQVRPYSPDPRSIFSNVVLTCADIPVGDKEAIIGASMALGGMESKDVTRLTTHVCALSMDHPKCQQVISKGLKCKIVLPHWFDDCFKLGKRIDETPYLLPDPEILRAQPEDHVKIPSSQHLEGATSAIPDSLPEVHPEGHGRRNLVVFLQKKVLLSSDLPISARLRKILQDLIKGGGGEVVDSVESCDMFICQYREGHQYVRAAQSGKDVGNLAWLYHLIVHNEWTSPLRRLLHYPIPKDGIPGFKDMKITLSNYGGEARIYLENLIVAAGATFTKTMKADNTHLITARLNSEKCEAAKDWNINIVNHLWIEESYAKCAVQPLTVSKYTHFPSRTNLGEVIGQTFLDESKLRDLYYPGGGDDDDNDDDDDDNGDDLDVPAEKEADMAAGQATKRGARKFDVMKDSAQEKAAAPAGAQKKNAYATPAKSRHVRVGKENDTPSILSSGSRSAKAQALSKLHDLSEDIALYEKEKKRTAKDGPWGGKRAAEQIDRERSRKSSSPVHVRPDEEGDEDARRPAKKMRPTLPPAEMRIVLTGYKRWVGDKDREDADRRKLRKLGILIVTENVPCDYLAAPQIVRTMKFLRTLAKGVDVLDASFIDACLDTGKVPDVQAYMLKDKESEKRFGVTIKKATARARANRGRLLWNVPIYCTAEIKNGVESYRAIAEANGAIFKVYRARSGTTIRPTTAEEEDGAAPEPVYLLTSTSEAEKQLWPRFEEMARNGNMEPRIVVSDWLLDVAMKQELIFDKRYLVKEYFKTGA